MTHEHRELRACGCVIVHKRVEVCQKHGQLPPDIRDRLSEMVSKVMVDEIDAAVEIERQRLLKKIEEFKCSMKAQECTARHFGYNLAIDDVLELLKEPVERAVITDAQLKDLRNLPSCPTCPTREFGHPSGSKSLALENAEDCDDCFKLVLEAAKSWRIS